MSVDEKWTENAVMGMLEATLESLSLKSCPEQIKANVVSGEQWELLTTNMFSSFLRHFYLLCYRVRSIVLIISIPHALLLVVLCSWPLFRGTVGIL